MRRTRWSVAVILSLNGASLDSAALADVPLGKLVRAEFARGERAACVAATLEHECNVKELLRVLRVWAAGKGWKVTVAPLKGPG